MVLRPQLASREGASLSHNTVKTHILMILDDQAYVDASAFVPLSLRRAQMATTQILRLQGENLGPLLLENLRLPFRQQVWMETLRLISL